MLPFLASDSPVVKRRHKGGDPFPWGWFLVALVIILALLVFFSGLSRTIIGTNGVVLR